MRCRRPVVDMRTATARRIAASVHANSQLLVAVVAVRATPDSDHAVAAVLELRELRVLRASWMLFEELVGGRLLADGWLLTSMPRAALDLAERALFGVPDVA